MPGRHRRDPDSRAGRGSCGHDPPEQPVPCLVDCQHGERCEHGCLVQHDLRGVDEGDLRDQRQERLPEWECVARVEPSVGELVHRAQVEVAQLDELTCARQVEEPITADLAGDVPEQQAQHGSGGPHPRAPGDLGHRWPAHRKRRRDERGDEEQHEREGQGGVRREDHSHRGEDDPEAPGERGRGAPHPDCPRGDRPGCEHEAGREREPDEQEYRAHRSISERTSPVPSQRAASRYIAPFSPRTILPRRTVAVRSNERTLSAWASPWCLRKNRMWPRRLSR